MSERGIHPRLWSLTKRWRRQGWVYCVLLACCAGLVTGVFLSGRPVRLLWLAGLVFVLGLAAALTFLRYWRLSPRETASWLDRVLPELEDSSALLLKPVSELGALERLQAGRVAARLDGALAPRPFERRLAFAWMGLVFLIGLNYVSRLSMRMPFFVQPGSMTARDSAGAGELRPAGVSSVSVRVIAPAYTGRAVREQERFDLEVEEGASLAWTLTTDRAAKGLQFIFNDSIHADLHSLDTSGRVWRLSASAGHGGFYQVVIDGKVSPLYKLVVIHDEAPKMVIRQPKPYTVIDFGESKKVMLAAGLHDDYGISDAGIVATVASGSGEAVKFKEVKLAFDAAFTGGRRDYDLKKVLDLDALGVKPGDELYFYCHARDNHGQECRTDMYIISLPDTAKLMSMEGMTTGLDIKPELFRSERQIIIETEALLRAKDTIAAQAFKDKCNSLGLDQKLLRLRYGKFLGEEAEEGKASEAYDAAGGSPADFSNEKKVKDAFTDKHDNAEDATFLEPAVKEQLKATLTEMWNSELRLRTFQAQEALPYEYKALRLLKDLQQKSRAFVAKTGVKVTPLDLKKRLTGKLEEIGEPVERHLLHQGVSKEDELRMALALLEEMRAGGQDVITGPGSGVLERAMRVLDMKAIERPNEFLEGYRAMKRIFSQAGMRDIELAEGAIRRILPELMPGPVSRLRGGGEALSATYFNGINE